MRLKVSLAIIVLANAAWMWGQTTSGSISGAVVDAQRATIPDATVTATEQRQNIKFTTRTDVGGRFVFAQIPAGDYTINVVATGMKKYEQVGVQLHVDETLALGELPMEVGSTSESIEVTANVALLQTESAERSDTLESSQIENIAINGRNALDLTKLVPGVAFVANASSTAGLGDISVNGSRYNSNQFTINGVTDIDTGYNGSQNATVSKDSVEEFQVLTGTYQAEYGRSAGAQINLVTKSGTNQFHGSGYWHHRNESLDANSWYNNVQGLPRNLLRLSDEGFTIGGPVELPKFRRLKNKLFFFESEEWQQQTNPLGQVKATVPTALERQGNFSQTVDDNTPFPYTPLTITDPTTGHPYPNNIIPPSSLSKAGVALLNLLPLPNFTPTPELNGYNYVQNLSQQQPRREDNVRIDYNATDKLRFYGSFLYNVQNWTLPLGVSYAVSSSGVPFPTTFNNPGYHWTVGSTYVISPNTTNVLTLGISNNSQYNAPSGKTLTTANFQAISGTTLPSLFPNASQGYLPSLTFQGGNIANGPMISTGDAPYNNLQRLLDVTDAVSKVKGSHSIKLGIFVEHSQKNQSAQPGNISGQFNGAYDFSNALFGNPFDTGYAYANAAIGSFNSYEQSTGNILGQYRYYNVEGYVQDTWKVTSRLTLDYGMRISWYQPQYDAGLNGSTFSPSLYSAANAPKLFQPIFANGFPVASMNPLTGAVGPSADIGLEVPGTGTPLNGLLVPGKTTSQYLVDNRGPQWGPRFGLAFDLTGKGALVLRAGGGIFYDRTQGTPLFQVTNNPPTSIYDSIYYGNFQYANSINPANVLSTPPTIYFPDPSGKIPTTYSYQFSIQAKLPWHMVLDTAYVGSLSRHLLIEQPLNDMPYGTLGPANAQYGASTATALTLLPYQGYSSITEWSNSATSNYNSLQVSLQRRAAKGLFFGAAFTWSKSLTTAYGFGDYSFGRIDGNTRIGDYGYNGFNIPLTFALNYVYQIPSVFQGHNVFHSVLDGWVFSGVTQIQSGGPFNFGVPPYFDPSCVACPGLGVVNSNAYYTGSTTDGPRVVINGPLTIGSGPYGVLNQSQFALPAAGKSVGLDSAVNYCCGPGANNWDMALQKDFSVKEKVHLQLKLDAFNAINHTQFSGINTTPLFGSFAPGQTPFLLNPGFNNGVPVLSGFGNVSGSRAGRIVELELHVLF